MNESVVRWGRAIAHRRALEMVLVEAVTDLPGFDRTAAAAAEALLEAEEQERLARDGTLRELKGFES